MLLVFIWILNLKYSIFSSHKWSVGGFSKRYHWKQQNTELAVESRLWWNRRNSFALSHLVQFFVPCFSYNFFFLSLKKRADFKKVNVPEESQTLIEELLGFLSVSLTRRAFMYSNWQQTRSYEASWKQANICLCSFMDSKQVTLGF